VKITNAPSLATREMERSPIADVVNDVDSTAVHEAPDLVSPIALKGTAFLQQDEIVVVDEVKPGGIGHLEDGRGFVLMEQLERV